MVSILICGFLGILVLFVAWRHRIVHDKMIDVYDHAAGLHRELLRAEQRCSDLHKAVTRHRNARGHDSCWLNDNELYAACGLDPAQRCLPPLPEFLSSCARYYQEQAAGAAATRACAESASQRQELSTASSSGSAVMGGSDCESCAVQCDLSSGSAGIKLSSSAATARPAAEGQGRK